MTVPTGPHRSSLAFEHIWVREAVFVDATAEYSLPAPGALEQLQASLEVQVKMVDNGRRAYVRVRAAVTPPQPGTPFQRLSAAVEGAYSLVDGDDPQKLEKFAKLQGPVLLLPYLRATISGLTAQARIGAIILPPLNMVGLLEEMQGKTGAETAAEGKP